jgi:hypothetical protein
MNPELNQLRQRFERDLLEYQDFLSIAQSFKDPGLGFFEQALKQIVIQLMIITNRLNKIGEDEDRRLQN